MSESSMAGRTRRLRIGVLDNDSCALEYIVAMLKQSTGSESNIADVWAYTKPAQAVQECRFGQHTDILIVDMALNGLTGAQVAAEIRRISPDTGIIGITSYTPEVYEQALADAGASPEQVGYINAHGTSTPLNDSGETAAIKAVFGAHAAKLAVSSTKSMTGHMLGAAGAVEAIFTALALRDGFLPATIHYQVPDPACDLDYIPNHGRAAQVEYAMSDSLGFGGHNACVVFKRWEG